MSFANELKDFASSYSTVSRARYQAAATEKLDRENRNSFDLDKTAEAEGAKKPHGMMYNLGKWLGITDDDKPAVAVETSPVAAVEKKQNMPVEAYDAATTTAVTTPVTPATTNDGSFNYGFPRTEDEAIPAYAAGGFVGDPRDNDGKAPVPDEVMPTEAVTVTGYRPKLDDGGPPADVSLADDGGPPVVGPPEVTDDGKAPVPDEVMPTEAITVNDTSAPAPGAPNPQQVAASADLEHEDDTKLAAALHGGILSLTQNFNLDPKQGAVPDPETVKTGQKALMSGEGRASHADIQAVVKAVDPDGQLGHSQAMLRAMTKGYEFYMEHGDPVKANNYAAMIIQYSTFEASKHGEDALAALKKGDINSAAKSLQAGYSNIPDGKEATNVKVSPDGKSVSVTETSVATGKPIAEHTLSGQQLYQAAIGLADKSSSWKAIMSAAAAAKGVNLPPSDAYNNAMLKLSGVGPDGAPLTQAGNAAPAAAAPANTATPAPLPAYMGNYGEMMRAGESGPKGATAKNGDSVGLYQIQSKAWRDATGHDPIVNGVDERTDPVKNTAVFKQLTQQNEAMFKKKFNRDPQPQELALMHQQGATGGMALIAAPANAKAVDVLASIGVKNPAASLTGNGVPATATAAQAVQKIQSYYLGKAPKGGQAKQPSPMTLRPALPEDQPAAPDIPERPKPPEILRVSPEQTDGMSQVERQNYTRQVARMNQENAKKFTQEMQVYSAAVKAAKPPAKGKDPLSLPVKDRGDATGELAKARATMEEDPKTSPFATLQKSTQVAADDIAYGFYTHNDTTAHRAYQAALSMLSPAQTNFTPYEMPDGNVKVVFRTGDKMVIPKNTFDQIAAARGNENYIMRSKNADATRKAAENAKLVDKGKTAVKAVAKSAANAAAPAAPFVGATIGAGKAIGDGLDKLFSGPPSKERPTIVIPTT